MKGHHAGIVVVGKRIPVFARRVCGVGLVVLVAETGAGGNADKSEVARFLAVNVIFRSALNGRPAYGCAVAHHPVGGVPRPGALPGRRSKGLPAVGIHRRHLVPQGVGTTAASKGQRGCGGDGQGCVQFHLFQAPGIVSTRCVAPHYFVQRIFLVGQIDHIAHLRVAERKQIFRRIGGRHDRCRGESGNCSNAQGFLAKNQKEILARMRAEGEGEQHGIRPKLSQEAGAGPPGHIAMQAGEHVFHAGNAVAVTGKVIPGRERGRYLAAGKVLQGYAHDCSVCKMSGVSGQGVASPPPSHGAPGCSGRARRAALYALTCARYPSLMG